LLVGGLFIGGRSYTNEGGRITVMVWPGSSASGSTNYTIRATYL